MRTFIRTGLVAVPLALGLALSALSTAPASASATATAAAADPLTFEFGDCDRIPALLWCYIAYKGGTPPVTVRWYKDGVHKPQFDDKKTMRIGCRVGKDTVIEVVVTDATGNWFKFTTWGTCSNTADWASHRASG
ncbi:hypothetical protein SAMN05444920_109207 [Nonomuraea solani]|uniref:Ig-like domain-containing protein n=1 Tax=Nonomuraea solani TaxID=1144553 RepID=A0A1H6EDP6_9ACTN|nr:hypothetical protein [Nonomuraea solani]SEG95940.1 hypothetical protein SAMN05444920_109207 [Nonomuraea solani]